MVSERIKRKRNYWWWSEREDRQAFRHTKAGPEQLPAKRSLKRNRKVCKKSPTKKHDMQMIESWPQRYAETKPEDLRWLYCTRVCVYCGYSKW